MFHPLLLWGVPNLGVLFWGPYEKGPAMCGSMLGVPYFRKLPGSFSTMISLFCQQNRRGSKLRPAVIRKPKCVDHLHTLQS